MASPGVYIFYRSGYVAYVGRSDSDVHRRESDSYRATRYDRTTDIVETSCSREAYRQECRLWHKHRPCDNERHPAVPRGQNWRCPVKGCCWE